MVSTKRKSRLRGSSPGRAQRRQEERSTTASVVVADESELLRTWMCQLLQVRTGWKVMSSAVDTSSITARLPEAGRQIVIIGSPDPGVALSAAEKLRSVRPGTGVILFTEFDSARSRDRAKNHVQAVVSRNTVLAGTMLAAVEAALQGTQTI
jgi:DNA-binding NarL/FixJ family response regulator